MHVESPPPWSLTILRPLGGVEQTPLGPEEIFDGEIGIARDPQGPVFGLFAGEVDP